MSSEAPKQAIGLTDSRVQEAIERLFADSKLANDLSHRSARLSLP